MIRPLLVVSTIYNNKDVTVLAPTDQPAATPSLPGNNTRYQEMWSRLCMPSPFSIRPARVRMIGIRARKKTYWEWTREISNDSRTTWRTRMWMCALKRYFYYYFYWDWHLKLFSDTLRMGENSFNYTHSYAHILRCSIVHPSCWTNCGGDCRPQMAQRCPTYMALSESVSCVACVCMIVW